MRLASVKSPKTSKLFSRRDAVKSNAIAAAVRHSIINGRFRPGDRIPTRAKLVRQHGVSINTVQKALDELACDGFVVAQGTRGTFVAEHLPHLARCGLVTPPLSDRPDHDLHKPFYAALLTEAVRHRQRGDLELNIYEDVAGQADDPHFRRLADDVRRCRLAGLIMMNPEMFADTPLAQFCQNNLPTVSISSYAAVPNLLRVHPNQDQLIEQALDFLAAQGCRRIAVLDQSSWKWKFIRTALAARGLTTRPTWMHFVPAAARATARGIMALLLESRELPDGLFIADDSLVEPATAGLRDGVKRRREQIKVVAHANFPDPTPSHVPIHRVGFDVREVLAECVKLIQQRRRGQPVPAVTEIAPVWADKLHGKVATGRVGL